MEQARKRAIGVRELQRETAICRISAALAKRLLSPIREWSREKLAVAMKWTCPNWDARRMSLPVRQSITCL